MCYIDTRGFFLIEEWEGNVDLGIKIDRTSGKRCVKLIDDSNNDIGCKSFRVKMTASVRVGVLTLSDIQFGDKSLCIKQPTKRRKIECSFEDGDCGMDNDACGVVDWEFRNNNDDDTGSHKKRSITCFRQKGVPLLKKQIREVCSFEDLAIAKLQRSGFTIIKSKDEDTTAVSKSTFVDGSFIGRKRRSHGSSLYLDPSQATGVAIGVLNLPEVEHHQYNAFLSFYHDMGKGGLHDLIVTAVCTSDPADTLIPLYYGNVHYHKSNFDGKGSSGVICLDIDTYVFKEMCSTFAIQMIAAAIETSIIVDNIYFVENLSRLTCKPRMKTPMMSSHGHLFNLIFIGTTDSK
jgi:hypothetical protein